MKTPSEQISQSPTQVASKVQMVTLDSEHAGQRIDNFLLTFLKGVPKTRIYRLLRKGEVRVNKGRVKPEYRIAEGDVVRIPPVRIAERGAPAKASSGLTARLEAAVIYEDEALLVLNKPSGLAVHGGSGVSLGLIEALRQARPEARYLELVHRLDRETSGCLMVAKKRSMLRHLQDEIRHKRVTKVYNALVIGRWPNRKHQVAVPLRRDELRGGERIVRVADDGKPSLTEFAVLQRFNQFTLVEAKPVTGRTHQIRVHAQHAGHPLVGDDKYGQDEVNKAVKSLGGKRLFLHAVSLAFFLPGDKKRTRVSAPLADDLQSLLSNLDAPEAE